MEENNLQEVKRPWQGTAWAWISAVIISLMSFIVVMIMVFGTVILGAFLNAQGLAEIRGFAAGIFVLIIIVAIPLFILNVLLIMGFFKGWKWAVIVAIILESLGIIGSLFGIGEDGGIFNLLIAGFMLYLAIACIQHPFYNKQK